MGNYQLSLLVVVGLLGMGPNAWSQEYVPGEVIVKFKQNNSGAQFSSKATGMAMNLKRSWGQLGVSQFQAKAGQTQDVEALIKQLKNDPNVEFAEPNYIYRMQSVGQTGPKMTLEEIQSKRKQQQTVYSKTGGETSFTASYSQSGADINVEGAWGIMTSSTSQVPVVAVIDSGVDYTHPVFTATGAIWSNTHETLDGVDNDGNGYIDDIRGWNFVNNTNNPMDDNNHGTHVAGIILGVSQDITVPTGQLVPAKFKIMPLKFLSSSGAGSTSDAIEAIYYAIDNGASIINASWGGGGYSVSLLNAIVAAYNAKVTFVAAAGNSHLNNDNSPTYPANYDVDNVVSIAATTDYDAMCSFTNFGKQTVHIASPGEDILSTLPSNSWAEYSGTSMATPLVVGIIALMEREAGAVISGYQARQILLGENDENVGNVTGKVISDSRVNVYKAVEYVQTQGVDNYQPTYGSDRAPAAASGAGGGCGLVSKIVKDSSSEGGGDLFGRALLMLIVLTPFVIALVLKQKRKEIENRREHQRYNISSEVRIAVGDRELVGAVSSISMGGLKIDTEAMLENGGIIEMNIMSPDGKEKIQVMGKVVWSAERKSYGVAFCDMATNQTSTLSQWTKKLVKAS